MKFLLDECQLKKVSEAMKALEEFLDSQIDSIFSLGMAGATDEQILELQEREGYILITADSDFKSRPHLIYERQRRGLITFCFSGNFAKEKFHVRLAFLIRIWPDLRAKAQESKAGDAWEVYFSSSEFKTRSIRVKEDDIGSVFAAIKPPVNKRQEPKKPEPDLPLFPASSGNKEPAGETPEE